ncbi:MAG: OmpA family protein [Rhodospirillales bacterium]|jgi:OmpA-OmpF porin, OOP family|nr:OmpA family protein [Rhodospirillales bacterium]
MRILILGTFLLAEAAAAVFLTGCGAGFDYKALRAMQTEGDGFETALARGYKEFALFESNEMRDWPDAAHFGEKAIAAANGAKVGPEPLKQWSLPRERIGEMTAARARLTKALDQGAGHQWPETAALAQIQFDCWVEQQEENWQTEHIAQCRDGYFAAMDEIDRAIAVSRANSGSTAIPAVAVKGDAAVDQPKSFTIHFDFDSADLKFDATEALNAIAETADLGKDVRVVISGHTDLAGPDPFNDRLSRRRAEAVSGALVARGISSDHISVTAHGERRPRITTPNGVREARNRRVEITVGPAPAL